jgi:hypothetical protein
MGGDPPHGAQASLKDSRDQLYAKVVAELEKPELHDEEIQYELARWVHLLETCKNDLSIRNRRRWRWPVLGPDASAEPADAGASKDEVLRRLMREAGAAIPALLSLKPELVFARTLRIQAEIALLRHNGWFLRRLIRWTGGSPVLTVGLGALGAALIGAAPLLFWREQLGIGPFLASIEDLPTVATAVAAAFLGGLVSVLTRLQAFSRLGDFDHIFLFANALFKPFLGAVFGLFAYVSIKGGILPLNQEVLLTPYHAWAIAFLAGFSERFMNDLVSRGEGLAAPKKS